MVNEDMERLDETQQNAVVMFVRFLLSQKSVVESDVKRQNVEARGRDSFWDAFERIREKAAIDHKDHEWTMDEIDAEIAECRRERRERQLAGAAT